MTAVADITCISAITNAIVDHVELRLLDARDRCGRPLLPPGADEQLHLMNRAVGLMRRAHEDLTGACHDATMRELMNILVRVQTTGEGLRSAPASSDQQGSRRSARRHREPLGELPSGADVQPHTPAPG